MPDNHVSNLPGSVFMSGAVPDLSLAAQEASNSVSEPQHNLAISPGIRLPVNHVSYLPGSAYPPVRRQHQQHLTIDRNRGASGHPEDHGQQHPMLRQNTTPSPCPAQVPRKRQHVGYLGPGSCPR